MTNGLSRRALLGGVGSTAAIAGTGALAGGTAHATVRPTAAAAKLIPPRLKPGDVVRIVSPASQPTKEKVARGTEILESWGLKVELAEHVFDKLSYLAGADKDRLADLNAALADPKVNAVFASRGGAGTQRIVDQVDFDAVRENPKIVEGFSDITILQLALWLECGLASSHGPTVNWDDARTGPESIESFRKAVMTTDEVVIPQTPDGDTAGVTTSGEASGILLGGNLSLIAASTGAQLPSLEGAILLIEEVGEAPYRVDRMLTTLLNAGALEGVKGVAVGQFTDCVGKPGEWTIVDLLKDRLALLDVPVLGGLPIGHGKDQLTVPLGTKATIDTAEKKLTVAPGVS